MSHADQIEAPGKILEVLEHNAYRAELANGHTCIARAAKGMKETYAPGDPVRLSFHPADLSRARIIPG
jgi:translation initiation factor IF-1